MGNICSCLRNLLPGSSGGYSEIPSEVQTTTIGSSANNATHTSQQKSMVNASNGYNNSSWGAGGGGGSYNLGTNQINTAGTTGTTTVTHGSVLIEYLG